MITTRFCPQCQQPLSADAPAGLCPQCLMKAAAGPPPSAAGDGLAADLIDIANPAEVAKKLPQFEILELLGRGGMGVVYKARQLNLDRIVALKILPPLDAQSPDFVARFTREARALAKLNHPNIVNVYDFGETGGLYWIIMEFVDGANLRQLFQTRKLTSAEALAIVPKICDALQYAHEEGLVHRDIKPENLLLDKKGRVKIADFGLAKLLRREPLDMTLTLSGMALGTLRYMAPEQMDKPETVDHRADLYSLGVVIYEMLTGETPVGRFELPSQKAQVDVRFDEIVLHALEREPDRRYQHASQVREDVEKVTSSPNVAQASSPVGPAGILPAVPGTAAGTPASPTDWKSVPQPPAPQSADNSPAPAAAKPSPRHLLSAFLVLLCLFGFFFGFSFQAKHSGSAAGVTKIITVGALDPLYTNESGPSGFQMGFNFFSWSFFAVVVSGIAFGAVWRIGREDQGKVPRDPAWWRDWWKQVGVWGGLLLTVCIVRTVMNPAKVLQPPGDRTVSSKFTKAAAAQTANPIKLPAESKLPHPPVGKAEPPAQPFMIGLTGPELTNEAVKKLKLSKLQTDEINRIVMAYHRDYLALQRRHSKVGKDDAGRIVVTIAPFYDECLALANRLQTELGGIVDPTLLPVMKDGELAFQIFNWGGAYNETVTMWKADGKYYVEEKLTSSPGHERDPFTFNISGPKLEEIPEAFRIFWREN
jgi:serine/threonine protein kinase